MKFMIMDIKKDYLLVLFLVFLFSGKTYSSNCDSCDIMDEGDVFVIKTDKSKRVKCLDAERSEIYDPAIPLFAEYGCKNKYKGKMMLLNMGRSSLISTFGIISYLKADVHNEAMYSLVFPIFASAITIPAGLLKGLAKGFIYESIYRQSSEDLNFRPKIGYSYTPAIGKRYAQTFTVFYRGFNSKLIVPDIYEVGYSFREYSNRNELDNNDWYEATMENFFIGSEWRLSNKRCFNIYGRLRAGYSRGDCFLNTSLVNANKISTPLIQLGCRYEVNAFDVFSVSLSTNYDIIGPTTDIEEYFGNVDLADKMSVNLTFGAFLF